jgi:uncharacterized oligopeptide transporter (OPT) family protein
MLIAVTIEILRVPVLPVAIGLYLPLELSSTIMLGGAMRFLADKGFRGQREGNSSSGILFCSGMIAGEGIIGIILAVLAVTGVAGKIDLSGGLNLDWATGLLLVVLVILVWISGTKPKKAA